MQRRAAVLWILGGLLLATALLSFLIGRYPIDPGSVLGIALSRLLPIEGAWTGRMETVFFNVRLPRVLLAMLVGASLSGAGAAFQSAFQNPMAAPDVLGASSGAGFGAALGIVLGLGSRLTALLAFACGLAAVLLAMLVARKSGGNRVAGLILTGIMVSSLFTAATSYVKLMADPTEQLPAITYWLMGSLSGARLRDVGFAAVPVATGLSALLLLSWRLNLLTLGDEEAAALGVKPVHTRLLVVLAATLVTAAAVAVSGVVGFVGLVVPHMARKLVGNDNRYLLPASILLGALFLLLVDDLARSLWSSEMPIGILTAFAGAPFFLYLLSRRDNA